MYPHKPPFFLSDLENTASDESPNEQDHTPILDIQMSRRFALAVGVSALLPSFLKAQDKEELPPPLPTIGEPEEMQEIDPQKKVLEDMKALKKKFGYSINKPHQAREIAPVIRKYNEVLKEAGHKISLADLEQATSLAIYGLYYRNYDPEPTSQKLPENISELEATLIRCCRTVSKETEKDELAKRKRLENSLRGDIFWHQCYKDFFTLRDHAAQLIKELYLPEEGDVTLKEYSDLLSKLSPSNPIAWRVILDTYPQAEQSLDKCMQELTVMSPEARSDFFIQYRKLCEAFGQYRDKDYERPESSRRSQHERFREWLKEKLHAPYGPIVERMSTLPLNWQGRQEVSHSIVEQMKKEDDLPKIHRQVCQWGLTPTDAIIGVPRTSIHTPQPYNVGPASTMFLDAYRAAMGAQSIADKYTHGDCHHSELQQRRKHFRKNSASIFLCALHDVCDMSEDGHEVNTLLIMALHGMKEEIKRMNRVPDMAEWGERTALIYTFPTWLE